jgi:pimeloyl-ACP methyl ester carboxylesterase
MNTAVSPDGTKIAYDRLGRGPALVLIDGAMCTRNAGAKPELARLLAEQFTVYSYDRRGRGDSGDTSPYAVEREIEDIETLIDDAGGTAALFGHSSGAALALEATLALGRKVTSLALYDAPYNDDLGARRAWQEYLRTLAAALGDGRHGDAVAAFMGYIGMPGDQISGLRQAPFWPGLEAIAPTLAYDHAALLGDGSVPAARAARVGVPTLVLHGDAGFPFMAVTARTLAGAIPGAEDRALADQTHDIDAAVLAPVLTEFYGRAV